MVNIFKKMVKGGARFSKGSFYTFQQINRKYSAPRIHPSPMVKMSLFMLRLYVLLILGVLAYKFFTVIR